jgi:hypothetical protein
MNSIESEGLGLSVLIYMTAILGGLALIGLPFYLATQPQVYDNPPLTRANPLLNGPVIGQRDTAVPPLAVLKHRTIVDPKFVATLNAKINKINQPERRHVSQQTAWRPRPRGQAVAEVRDEPQRPTSFFQRLFGG